MHMTEKEEFERYLFKHYTYYSTKMDEHKKWTSNERVNHYMKEHLLQFKSDVYMNTSVPFKHLFWLDEMLKQAKKAKEILYGAYVFAFCAFNMQLINKESKLTEDQRRMKHGPYKGGKGVVHRVAPNDSYFVLYDNHLNNLEKAVSILITKLDYLTDNSWSDYLNDVDIQKIYGEQYKMKPYAQSVANQIQGILDVINRMEMKDLR